MKQDLKEYIASLKPVGFPDGNALVREGREMADRIPWNKSRFLRQTGFETWEQYCLDCHKKGKSVFQLLMGLSTLEEQLDALQKIEAFYQRTGCEVRSVQAIPSSLVGLPAAYWENAPRPTSYTMKGEADWLAQTQAAAVDVCWEDWHLSSPNNLQQTIYALQAGTSRLGSFAQYIWDFPGWSDEKNRFSDMCRSMGILSAKKEQGMTVSTYPEDGVAGYFMDVCSMLGYVMLEHYIIEDLCGARMVLSYGGLLSEIVPRIAFGLACEKLYGSKDRMFVVDYNGSTNTAWNHDIEANYGIGAQEMLLEAAVNLHYDLAIAYKPVSITEAIRVPTLEELLHITRCGLGAIEKAAEWEAIIDFSRFETVRDQLIDKGTIFYHNILNALEQAGVNIRDPLEMIVTLKRFDPMKLESELHPSVSETGAFQVYVPTVLYKQTMQKKNDELAALLHKGYGGCMRGQKVVCVSADGHSYGLLLIRQLWRELDAEVIDGGVYMEPASALDLADEEGAERIAISIHCGQCLDYAKRLIKLARHRNKTYKIAMGGVLNAMLPGYAEPVDVADLIMELGILASNDFEKQVDLFLRAK